MTSEELIEIFDAEQNDENKKKEVVKALVGKETPEEKVIQTLFRIIRKPTIPEASEGVYDAVLEYLKSINRY